MVDSKLAELKLTLRLRKPVFVGTALAGGDGDMLDERMSGDVGVVSSVLLVLLVVDDETDEHDCRIGLRM